MTKIDSNKNTEKQYLIVGADMAPRRKILMNTRGWLGGI